LLISTVVFETIPAAATHILLISKPSIVDRYFVIISSKFLKSEFLNFTTFVSSILESFREVIATANLEFVPPISATKVFNSLGPITFDSYV